MNKVKQFRPEKLMPLYLLKYVIHDNENLRISQIRNVHRKCVKIF